MIRKKGPADQRDFRTEHLNADLVVVGGGMAGTCCAITAARAGVETVLIQDRPVLGGNASSEVRLWILGATSHMSNNNRWAREGGVIDEILVENTFRNPEGNPVLVDTILLEKVKEESNITLLLNTAVFDVEKDEPDRVSAVRGFCSQNSTMYEVQAPLFCDASGDGVVGFLSGAAFRMGAEAEEEFGEKFAPDESYGELLGHSIYFYTRDVGEPVDFVPPSYALPEDEVREIGRYRNFDIDKEGSQLWWIEYGGRLDTVHQTEEIKWELWRVIYGIWNYFKNSGEFPEAETMTLSWVGTIPGKRESRRFEGDYMLKQQDVVEQRTHRDAVSVGGWSLDLHPADAIYSSRPGCDQWHSRGVYQIPYRCMYSRNIENLFLAGRILSASHVAFGSSRVMATCASNAQAVGHAAALCLERDLDPAEVATPNHIETLQRNLLRSGQYIPGHTLDDPDDLAQRAAVEASSQLALSTLPVDGPWRRLDDSWAMLLPVSAGPVPDATFHVRADTATTLHVELRTAERRGNYTPRYTHATQTVDLVEGKQAVTVTFGGEGELEEAQYAFYCLMANEDVSVRCSTQRLTGVLAVTNRYDEKVARSNRQDPPEDIGVESFEFWRPLRRPDGENLALQLDPPLEAAFAPENVTNGIARPTMSTNAWVADPADDAPHLTLHWKAPQPIRRVVLTFDTDFDHPMESVLMGHPERAMPFCVRAYRLCDADGTVVAERTENHQTRNVHRFEKPLETSKLRLHVDEVWGNGVPAALFGWRCYETA